MDVNEAIIHSLEAVGVEYVFGGSGQVNASMMLALKASETIRTIVIRNEQAASFMACGYAMFADNLGVCFATGGPGAFNLFSGLAVAYSDSLPVIAISGYPSASTRGKGPLNGSSGLKRTPDSQAMFSATTKKSYIIEHPDQVCSIMEDAINTAFEGRPGPVHVHVPKDITMAEVTNFRTINLHTQPVVPQAGEVDAFVAALADILKKEKKVMALIGYGCVRSDFQDELLSFLERFQIPFATTMDGKGILPEDHPLSLGVFGTSGDPGAKAWFNTSTAFLAIGNSFAQNATFNYKQDLFEGKTLFHINIDPDEVGKVFQPGFALVSDAHLAVAAIRERLEKAIVEPKVISPPRAKFYDTPVEYSGDKMHPAELAKAISRLLPEKSIIMGDAGGHMLWLNCYLNLTSGQQYQNPGSFGPMASSVNGVLGVQAAHPDKRVVCGCGDGGYLMGGFELLTAVQYKLPVIWVIFNNSGFNIIKKFLLNVYGRHAFLDFDNPDYVKYADACGTRAYQVHTVEEFEKAFNEALSLNEPIIIDAIVESEVYPPFNLGKV